MKLNHTFFSIKYLFHLKNSQNLSMKRNNLKSTRQNGAKEYGAKCALCRENTN